MSFQMALTNNATLMTRTKKKRPVVVPMSSSSSSETTTAVEEEEEKEKEEEARKARKEQTSSSSSSSSSISSSKALLEELPKAIGSCSREELHRWLEDVVNLPRQKLALEYFKEEGRGLIATESIDRGEKVLEIPRDAIITVDVALKESLLERKKLSELQEWSILASFLAEMAQNLGDDRSSSKYRFSTYVKALPRSTGSVLEWPNRT